MPVNVYVALTPYRASLGAQTVKHSPAVQETQVRSLGREGPLEKEMAAHSSILTWKIPWAEEPSGRGLRGCRESGVTLRV